MPITIRKDSLFKSGYSIKYITGWDNRFKKDGYSGALFFYYGIPQYIVDVELIADRNKLKEEDIIITIGDHNDPNTEDSIIKNTDTIYEVCKSSIYSGFVLDLDNMKVLEPSDFSLKFPIKGLNTLFVFENLPRQIYCLVNPSKNVKDSDFYTWLVSYIYSYNICLEVKDKIEAYPKKFLQAISGFASTGGITAKISSSPTILDCGLSDVGELLLPVPGNNTKRFESLIEASLSQMLKKSHKKGRK